MSQSRLAADDLIFVADRNLLEATRLAALWTRAGEALTQGDLQLVSSGTRFPAGMFNCAQPLVSARDAGQARAWLDHALEFYAARTRGFSVYAFGARDQLLAEACAQLGMQPADPAPGMVLDAPVPEASLPGDVRIACVKDAAGIADFALVAGLAYERIGLPEKVAQTVFAEPGRVANGEFSLYVAYVRETPAATVLSLLSHGIAGIYWVGTRPDMQRRGLADAITRHASNQAFERGAGCVILQATKFGEPVYRRIGYRTFSSYQYSFLTRERAAALRAH